MRDVARQFPNDYDIQTMYAESLMNTNAWKLWTTDGKAAAGTDEIVNTLKTVLARILPSRRKSLLCPRPRSLAPS